MDEHDVEWRCLCGQKNIDHDERCVECGEARYPDEETLLAGTDWPADEAHRDVRSAGVEAMSDEGEDWKDEEPKPFWPSPFSFTVVPQTPEEKAAEKRRQEEAAAKAEILFVALPLFDVNRRCPKCHESRKAKTRHCEGTYDLGGCDGETGKHEHFHRTCKLCRYEWLERCLGEE